MKRFKHFLTELFDNPYKVQPFADRPTRKSYKFSVPIPDVVKKQNPKLRGSLMYVVEFRKVPDKGEDAWDISFDERSMKLGSGNFFARYDMQGSGGIELRVFSSVVESIKMFVEKQNPNKLFFISADREKTGNTGRTRLYARLVSKFANDMGYNYEVHQIDGATEFELTRGGE